MIHADGGAQFLEALQVQVDGSGADGASARKRNAGMAKARHQRAEHQHRSAHLLHQFVGRQGIEQLARLNLDAVAVFLVLDRRINSQLVEQAAQGPNVAHARDIAQGHALVRKQRGRDRRQRRVLRPPDCDPAFEGLPTFD